jgi:hypothetical protein
VDEASTDLFLTACGFASPWQVEVVSAQQDEPLRHLFAQPFALVGRDELVDLRLDHPAVSRRHVYLQVLGGWVFCTDLGSRTGTHWAEGARYAGWLDPERGVRVGPYRLRACAHSPPHSGGRPDDAGNPLSSAFAPGAPLPGLKVEFLTGDVEPPPWRMKPALVLVGTADACKVQLMSSTVSKYHASLVRTPAGVWVVDLFSRAGTFVNDARVRFARLNDGDELRIGKFLMRVHTDVEPRSVAVPFVRAEAPPALAAWPGGESAPEEPRSAALPAVPPTGPVDRAERGQRPPGAPANLGPLVQSLVNQFSQMQQQMAEQFQQTLLMMLQMFSTLHREQNDLVRQELASLHELTLELNRLQASLAGHLVTHSGDPAATPAPDAASAAGGAPAAPVREAREMRPAADPPANRTTPVTEQPGPTRQEPIQESEHIHLWLSRRIEAIQQERQTRWQRILGFLTGQ